ncbi:MAG: formyltransferase family protein [Gammaproteobacteria bacterium]
MTDVLSLNSTPEFGSEPEVLFFGRADCAGTTKILALLEQLKFRVTYVLSSGRGERRPAVLDGWTGDYIFCFRSLFILPQALLVRAKIAAINFHPAPPEYPGSGCVNFALYDECDTYGVTAHLMNEKIDNGRILDCRRFDVAPTDTLSDVLARTHAALTAQCLDVVAAIAAQGGDFVARQLNASAHLTWRGDARRMSELKALQNIDPAVSKAELKRLVRATYIEGYPPSVTLHGYEFALVSDQPKDGND